MTVLTIVTPTAARSSDDQSSGHQESSQSIEAPDNGAFETPVPGFAPNIEVPGSQKGKVIQSELSTEPYRSDPVTFDTGLCTRTRSAGLMSTYNCSTSPIANRLESAIDSDKSGEGSSPPSPVHRNSDALNGGKNIYYKNKVEFSLDGGWLPINIPFVFDVFLGDGYNKTPLNYTLVPIVASLRWQVNDLSGPWILRGNWDVQASAAVTLIPRGPESRYIAWIMGFRRNFVPRRGRVAPYFDGQLGLGNIDAKEPLGVLFAQGQDFTFTMNMGSGIRYNFSPRYSFSAGLHWMHISNLYLSEPQFSNYGINVYGPMFGINVRLGKLRLSRSE